MGNLQAVKLFDAVRNSAIRYTFHVKVNRRDNSIRIAFDFRRGIIRKLLTATVAKPPLFQANGCFPRPVSDNLARIAHRARVGNSHG